MPYAVRKLIDCHVHLNNYVDNPGRPTKENVQTLFDKMAEHGVDQSVVLTSYKVDVDRPSVEEVLEALASDPRTRRDEGEHLVAHRCAPLPHPDGRLAPRPEPRRPRPRTRAEGVSLDQAAESAMRRRSSRLASSSFAISSRFIA